MHTREAETHEYKKKKKKTKSIAFYVFPLLLLLIENMSVFLSRANDYLYSERILRIIKEYHTNSSIYNK